MNIRPIDANALIEKLEGINPVDYGAMSSYETHNGAREALSDAVMCVNDAPTLSLNALRDAIYEDAVEHGLWEESDRLAKEAAEDDDIIGEKSFKEKFFKWHEAAELIFYEGDEMLAAVEEYNWDSATEELADVVIMAMSAAGYLGIDIDAAIRRKMEINRQRPWKHEGEKK